MASRDRARRPTRTFRYFAGALGGGAKSVGERVGTDELDRGLDAVRDDRSRLRSDVAVVEEDVVDADRLQRRHAVGLARGGRTVRPRSLARIAVAIPTDEVPPRISSVCPGLRVEADGQRAVGDLDHLGGGPVFAGVGRPGVGAVTGRARPMGRIDAGPSPPASRLLRDWSQDRCLARLGPGARRDALTLRLPTGVIGVAHSWHAFSSGTARGEARKGFVRLEVAMPCSLHITASEGAQRWA